MSYTVGFNRLAYVCNRVGQPSKGSLHAGEAENSEADYSTNWMPKQSQSSGEGLGGS